MLYGTTYRMVFDICYIHHYVWNMLYSLMHGTISENWLWKRKKIVYEPKRENQSSKWEKKQKKRQEKRVRGKWRKKRELKERKWNKSKITWSTSPIFCSEERKEKIIQNILSTATISICKSMKQEKKKRKAKKNYRRKKSISFTLFLPLWESLAVWFPERPTGSEPNGRQCRPNR